MCDKYINKCDKYIKTKKERKTERKKERKKEGKKVSGLELILQRRKFKRATEGTRLEIKKKHGTRNSRMQVMHVMALLNKAVLCYI